MRTIFSPEPASGSGRVAHVLCTWGRRLFTLRVMLTHLRRYDQPGDSHF